MLQPRQLPGLVVEVGVQVFLNELGDDIDVGLQLLDALVVALGVLYASDAAPQAVAQPQHAAHRPAAVGIGGVIQQGLGQGPGSPDLLGGDLAAGADDVVVHFQVHVRLEVLIEPGGRGDVFGDGGILHVIDDEHHQDQSRQQHHGQEDLQHQPVELSLYGIGGKPGLHSPSASPERKALGVQPWVFRNTKEK